MTQRTYSKADPTLTPGVEDVSDKPQGEVPRINSAALSEATAYSKAEGIVQPECFVVVFCNGEKREKQYFNSITRLYPCVKVIFHAWPISPDDMLECCLETKKNYSITAGEECPDTYYAVTDVDHFYSVIVRCMSEYERNGISIIISNPCFEVWLYYSRKADRFDGFEMPDDPLKVSHCVKQFLDKRIKGGCDPRKAVMNIRQNIVNAQNNYSVDENGVPTLFSTSMFLFAEAVLPYIKQ